MSDKLYYSISEVSAMLGVSIPTLRFWEHEVKQLQPKTSAGKTRYYSAEDIDTIKRIIFLRGQNVPVKDLQRRLSLDTRVLDRRAELTELLKTVKAELTNLKNTI